MPNDIKFQTKPEIALEQIRRARERNLPEGVVLADAGAPEPTKYWLSTTSADIDLSDLVHLAKHRWWIVSVRRTPPGVVSDVTLVKLGE